MENYRELNKDLSFDGETRGELRPTKSNGRRPEKVEGMIFETKKTKKIDCFYITYHIRRATERFKIKKIAVKFRRDDRRRLMRLCIVQ